ncbi:MAG: hypothetical protein ACM30E_08905 [Nitrososphaerales archaeon]
MRAFAVAGRAIISFYNDMFVFIAMSLLWWVTGGVFVAVAAVVGLALFAGGGPWWIAPLIAIPAGPAIIALASIARQTTRGRAADRRDYLHALKGNWRSGLALNTLGMVVLALLLLNLVFYAFQANLALRLLSILWIYLLLFWASMQFYVYPFYLALEKPTMGYSLRMAALATFANPLFSVLLLAVALALTAVSVVLAILVVIAWPSLMALVGDHALRLLLQRAGVEQKE